LPGEQHLPVIPHEAVAAVDCGGCLSGVTDLERSARDHDSWAANDSRGLTLIRPVRYHGEQMAKGPDFSPEKPFSGEQLAEIRRNFAMLSTSSLQQAYSEALERCRLGRDGRPPKAEHIQVLVQAWRQLSKIN
jgi:hypothetical protein